MNNNRTDNILTTLFLSIFIFVISFIALTSLINEKADAYLEWPVGDCPVYRGPFRGETPNGWNVPADIYFGLNRADCNGNSPSVSFYTTIASSPTSSSITVPSGTASVDLAFRGAATVGWRPSSAVYTRYTVVGASSGVSGIVGEFVQTDLSGGPNTVGYTDLSTPNTFTFAPPGGFTTSRNYSGTLTVKVGQTFNNRGPACVANGAPASGIYDPNCPNSIVVFNVNVTVTPPPTRGCTNPAATNYNPSATVDDGSCVFPVRGCTDPAASNYNPLAAIDNGSCIYPPPSVNCPLLGGTVSPLYSASWSSISPDPPPPAYGNATYRRNVPKSVWVITGVNDVSSGGGRGPVTSVPAVGSRITSPSVQLNYTGLVNAYPYDTNQGSVSYYQLFDTFIYSASGSAVRGPSTYTDTNRNGRRDSTEPLIPGPIIGYRYVLTSTILDRVGGVRTTNATPMPPCYPRQFDATPSGVGAALITTVPGDSERENPTGARFTFRIPTRLFISNGGSLRTATQVNNDGINYTINWRADGYSGSTFAGSVNRTAVINNGNTASDITVDPTNASISVQEVSVSIPANIQAGDRICFSVTVTEPRGTVGIGGNILSLSAPATRTQSPAETCTVYAVDQPYSRFYGADVFAGGGFVGLDDTCSATVSPPDLPDLEGPYKGTNGATYSGTGVQLAAFAIGEIRAQALSQSGRNPAELSFANVSPPSGAFGGRFGTASCANNYFADISNIPDSDWDTTTGNIDLGLTDASALESGRHYFRTNGTGVVNIYGLIPDTVDANGIGKRLVIYVDGDVSIQANSAGGAGRFGFANNLSWPSVEAVPSLYIIARGNILIDDGVSELDGVLIAQQTEANPDTTGFIDTCSNNGTSLRPTAANITAISVGCRRPLRVNGGFIAQRVNLLRTDGSLRESQPLEGPVPTRAAETFIYNPTLWFSDGGNLPPNKKIQIDSYTSLPPSL